MADTSEGTLFLVGNGATPELFTALAEVAGVSGPSLSREVIDVTDLDDDSRQKVAGLFDSGEVTLDMLYTPDDTGHAALLTKLLATAQASTNYQVCWSNLTGNSQTVTVANATNIWTAVGHGLTTGQPVRLSTTGTLPDGASASTTYYVLWLSADTFTLHTTNAGAVAGTGTLDVSDDGSGTHSVTSGDRWDFTAYITGFEPSASVGDKLSSSVTFTATGSVTT